MEEEERRLGLNKQKSREVLILIGDDVFLIGGSDTLSQLTAGGLTKTITLPVFLFFFFSNLNITHNFREQYSKLPKLPVPGTDNSLYVRWCFLSFS